MFLTCFYKSYEHVHIWEEVKSHWHSLGRHDNVYLMSQWRSRSLCHGVCMRTHIHARARSHCLFLYFLNLSYCLKKNWPASRTNERTRYPIFCCLQVTILKFPAHLFSNVAPDGPISSPFGGRPANDETQDMFLFFLEYARTLSKWNAMLIISAGIAFLSQIVFYA